MTPSQQYLDTLLRYYEEEISGASYFAGLREHFAEKDKLALLAAVERHAAEAVEPLLSKYVLKPESDERLAAEGASHVPRHANMTWREFVQYMADRYPGYLDDFASLEAMAPCEDLPPLQKLTRHEVAAIEFAHKELAGDVDSCAPLQQYLRS